MWRHVFLLLALLPSIQATQTITCTNGFTLVGNKCLKLFTAPTSRRNASKTCAEYAGNLVAIQNQEENDALASFVGDGVRSVWLGLYCFGTSNCLWDDASGSNDGFSSFVYNITSVYDIYKCVTYKVTGSWSGRWFRGDCSYDLRPFVCQIPTTYEDECALNYNGNCYLPSENFFSSQVIGIDSARQWCLNNCAGLVSIHSANELRLIQNYYKTKDHESILVGAVTNSGKSFLWTDGSTWDYGSVVGSEQSSGTCVKLALKTSGSRVKGSFYVTKCEESNYYMCKRPAGISCVGEPAPSGETPPVTPNCNEFLMNSGSFSSPNYPETYSDGESCTYGLGTLGSQRIRVTFSNIVVKDHEDHIRIYDGDSVESPLAMIITGRHSEPVYYESSSNRVFVTYNTADNLDAEFARTGFKADFVTIV
ncbi:hypothetical protein CRE_13614 [Caenorhabditis remanei]|uniref:C-type LECtin n=1 Tax=Caenorhabditis remanei TaxID=31234 RepID=E3N1A1_CAERE|nr:hypothetical protein CRE_13614 [Caenorhabditis remanei]